MKNISAVNWISDAVQAGLQWLLSRYPSQTGAVTAVAFFCWLSSLEPGPWFGG